MSQKAEGASPLTPEEFVEELRALRARIADVVPLTAAQRRALRYQVDLPEPVIQASINVIGASDLVTLAIGQPAGDVRQMVSEANRWTAAEDELRGMLNGVSSGNLIRRQKITLIAKRAYGLGKQLARDPQNALLVPHVLEVQRLRNLARRRKRAPQAAETPAPETPPATEE
jgi:hypothetical protein